VSFADPDEDRTWLFDVSFLLSGWSCIYKAGCQGVLTGPAPELELGCCSYGAHFTSEEDARRVDELAEGLGPEVWQFRSRALRRVGGRPVGPVRRVTGGPTTTRLVEDACIFLNRAGFAGGAGCALHLAALADGVPPMSYKPDVCWQLPLRREDEVEANGHVVSRVTQWERRHWGPAGAEFAWWCSEDPAAYVASEPLYRRMDAELRELCGSQVVELLAEYLSARYPASDDHPRQRAARPAPLPHPVVRRSRA
jgi:hypothetical protein